MSYNARVHRRKNENNRCLLSLITSDNRNSQDCFPFLVFIVEFIDIFIDLLALSTFLDVLLLGHFQYCTLFVHYCDNALKRLVVVR